MSGIRRHPPQSKWHISAYFISYHNEAQPIDFKLPMGDLVRVDSEKKKNVTSAKAELETFHIF